MRILIADDHDEFRRVLRAMLQARDVAILECRDGREAIDRFDEFAPDWVLMDIEMPRLDGLAATRQLTTASPGARVLILTQHDDDDSRDLAREAGACQFLSKHQLELLPAILFSPADPAKGLASTL